MSSNPIRGLLENPESSFRPEDLLFLTNHAPEALAVLDSAASGADTDVRAWVIDLLNEDNWRHQLVGALTMLTQDLNGELLDELWRQLDRGSWAAPQLAGVAFMLDSSFGERARARVEAFVATPQETGRLPSQHEVDAVKSVDPERLKAVVAQLISRGDVQGGDTELLLRAARRHSAQGPGSSEELEAKAITALVALLDSTSGDRGRMHEGLRNPEVAKMLSFNHEQAGAIAVDWVQRLGAILGGAGE